MKKIVSILAVFVLCVAMVFPVTVSAASATASLTGPGTVRAGDTITLSFKLNGSGIYGVSGALSYDSNQVAFMGATQKIGGTWKADLSDRIFLVYDDELSAPINSNKTLFTVTFKVKDIPEGTKIKISYTAVTASDNFADINIGTVSYSATIAAPLSSDATLKSLTAGNATISPDFNPGITAYTAQVPFSVS